MEQENMSQRNPVVWFEIYVDDITRARNFYETVLAIKTGDMADPTNANLKMASFPMAMDAPNASGALVQMEGMKAGGNSTIVYFTSEDCAIEEARVEKAGGKIFKKKMSIGEYGFMSLCEDTEGNIFGIHSRK
ncbi:MAG: VOC family protein [Ginsengibacter sp.]